MKISTGINELARLNALQEYNILDTAPEPAFDDINRLAACICGTPIALISLIDDTRQWFKSKIGVDVSEISRDSSFCSRTIQQVELVTIEDTFADQQSATNPWVISAPNIRFYAGLPLITPEGFGIGTLCIMDRRPRELSPKQQGALRALSQQVVAQLELQRNLAKHERAEALLLQRSRLAVLEADVGIALTRSNSLRGILQQCTEALVRHLDAAFARIWTLNSPENILELQASAGMYTHINGGHSRVPVGKFKIGMIAQSCQPHLTNQVIGDPLVHNQAWARQEGIVAFAGYPLMVAGQLVGVMAVFACQPLSDVTLDAMATVANELSLGIQRKQAEEALRARERQQAVVAELGQRALMNTDLTALMNKAVLVVAQSLEMEYSKVLELLPEGDALLLRAGVGWQDGLVGNETVEAGVDSQPGYTLLSSEPVIVEDLRTETRFSGPPLLHNHGVVSGLSVIIHGQTRPFGVLGTHSTRRRTFTEDDVHFLQAIANVLAASIERKQIEAGLRQSEAKFRSLVEHSSDWIWEIDQNGIFTYVSPKVHEIVGYKATELLGKTTFDLMTVDERQRFTMLLEPFLLYQKPFIRLEKTLIHKEGHPVVLETSGSPIFNYQGTLQGYRGIARDITDRKQAERALQKARDQLELRVQERTYELARANEELQKEIIERTLTEKELLRSNERFLLAASAVNCVIYDWDLETGTVERTAGLIDVLGYSPEEAQPITDWWAKRIHPEEQQYVHQQIQLALANARDFAIEYRIRNRYDQYRYIWDRGIIVRNAEERAIRVVGSFLDITDRKQAEEQLLHDALHDRLTGLPNRALFMDRLARVLELAKRRVDYVFAVLFLDLDRFKIVNDSLGHTTGDQLLIAIAHRLQECLRPSDTVARLGGDEFTILLDDIEDTNNVIRVAKRIQAQLATPFNLDGHEVFTTASIGITSSTTDYDQPEEVLRNADIAMYRAKALGRARCEVFGKDMHTNAVARLQLEMDLRRAIERQEFELYYQPIVSLETGRITGFESLLRWQHPSRGLILPTEFISLAEETGLIIPIGQWVLHKACSQMKEWRQQLPTARSLTINVNLSGKQFIQPDLIKQIKHVLQEADLKASDLSLEITESMIMENADIVSITLFELRALGVQLQMDDFGTGYSSFSYLHRFPIDMLKIDRSFISRIGTDTKNLEIVRAIVILAHSLGMKVTAEGVETEEQLAQLMTLKCECGQGYFFAKPTSGKVAGILIAQGLQQ